MGDKIFKLVGIAITFGAAALARKVANGGWKAVMNDDPPANPEDPDTTMWEAIAWALGSAAIVALARLLASRQWARYYKASTGTTPNADDVS